MSCSWEEQHLLRLWSCGCKGCTETRESSRKSYCEDCPHNCTTDKDGRHWVPWQLENKDKEPIDLDKQAKEYLANYKPRKYTKRTIKWETWEG